MAKYHVVVDGHEEASGLQATPDNPEAAVQVGEAVTGMAPEFNGMISSVRFNSTVFYGTDEPLPPPPTAEALEGRSPVLIYKPWRWYTLTDQLKHLPSDHSLNDDRMLVVTMQLESMERDGTARFAMHTATIDAPGKQDIPLHRYVAAYVPVDSIGHCVITHRFLLLRTKLHDSRRPIPAGWRRNPPTCGAGSTYQLSEIERVKILKESSPNDLRKLDEFKMVRKPGEADWRYARRARQFLGSRVKYGPPEDGHLLDTRVGHCGSSTWCYASLLNSNGVPCQQTIGEWVGSRGEVHCVTDVFIEGSGWVPVEPQGDKQLFDKPADTWGYPAFTGKGLVGMRPCSLLIQVA